VLAEERYLDFDYYTSISSSYVKEKAKNSLLGVLRDYELNIDHFDIGTDPKVQLTNLHVSVKSQKYSVEPSKQGLRFHAENTSVKMDIGEVKVDQIIERVVNGVIVRIRVFALCSGVTASLGSTGSVIEGSVNPVINGDQIRLKLEEPNIVFGKLQFGFDKIKCEGAQGFDELIIKSAKEMLADPVALAQLIQTDYLHLMQNEIDQWGFEWKKPRLAFRLPVREDSKSVDAWFYPQSMRVDENGNWQNRGMIRVAHPDQLHDSKKISLTSDEFSDFNNQTVMIIPDEALTALAEIYLSPGMWHNNAFAHQIPAFQSLLKSRIKQMFVWPDLWNFPKKTDFLFQMQSKTIPQFTWKDNGSISLQSEFLINMMRPKSDSYRPYILFDINMKGQFQLAIQNGQGVLVTQGSSVQAEYKWADGYCNHPGRCGKILKNSLAKAATSYFTGRQIQFPLPQLEAGLGIKIEPKKLRREKKRKLVIIDF